MFVNDEKLNLTFYNGHDEYSDGDVEEKLLDIVKSEVDFDKAINQSNEFAIFYHLSKEREHLVQVMDIKKDDELLEVGSGCGALTGAFANRARHVDCIELSRRRSLVNAYKNKEQSNFCIYVGNYEDVAKNLKKKYNVITLIGVFEYAGYYIHTFNPYQDFLKDVLLRLNEGGKLYIAIENRLGAKYFSGCEEDHLGKEGIGLEGYPERSNVRTFSYYELIKIMRECGVSEYRFFYPFPDYKFPHKIFTDDFLPENGELLELGTNYMSKRQEWFDEIKFINSLQMDEEFKIFSNSYMIEITK